MITFDFAFTKLKRIALMVTEVRESVMRIKWTLACMGINWDAFQKFWTALWIILREKKQMAVNSTWFIRWINNEISRRRWKITKHRENTCLSYKTENEKKIGNLSFLQFPASLGLQMWVHSHKLFTLRPLLLILFNNIFKKLPHYIYFL